MPRVVDEAVVLGADVDAAVVAAVVGGVAVVETGVVELVAGVVDELAEVAGAEVEVELEVEVEVEVDGVVAVVDIVV